MIACPQCQTANDDGARFCVNCGVALPPPTASTAKPRPWPRRAAATQPLSARPPFAARPAGAVFADRFVAARPAVSRAQRHVYEVTESALSADRRLRQCPNAECGAVHDVWVAPEQYCTACAAPLGADRPVLALAEAPARDAFGSAFDVAGRPLVHGALRAPVAAFSERVAGAARYCLVAPRVEPLPPSPARVQVWRWGAGLAQALDYLHGAGVSFGGQVDAGHFGLADGHAVWQDFSRCRVDTLVSQEARAADARALALQLYQWLTGRIQFALDPTLPLSANSLFSQLLSGAGPVDAAQLAQGFVAILAESAAPPGIDYFSGRRSDVGRVRTLNEDSVLALELGTLQQSASRPMGLYAVADGMGGHAAGEVASGLLVNALAQKALADLAAGRELAVAGKDRLAWLRDAVALANQAVFERRQAAGTDMGSTLVAALLDGTQAYIAHVGDSRAYLIRGGGIRRLTADHSLVERLVQTGQITRAEAQTHPQRNVIYRTMGDRPRVEVDVRREALSAGDRVLLCSDGLSGKLADEEISKIVVEQAASPQDACERLVAAANRAGGDDNISVVVVEIVKA